MISSFSITDIGKKRRMNQDYVFSSDRKTGPLPNLYVVADGMGGHKAGDYASRYAVDELVKKVMSADGGKTMEILEKSLHDVNRGLYHTSQTEEKYEGCGTTIVVATMEGTSMTVANVGDSRLYVVSDRRIRQITIDHSLVEEMVLAGSLDEKRARTHPDKNVITRAVGAERHLDVDFFNVCLEKGDIVLMCTDGLTNMLEDEEILRILHSHEGLENKARSLVAAANEAGGTDNITVTLINAFTGES